MPEQYANLATTTLAVAYTSGGGTATVGTNGVPFPTSYPFHVYVLGTDNLIKVLWQVTTASSSNLFLVTPEGNDANVTASATIRCALTAGAMNQIRSDIHQFGSSAGLPSTAGQTQGNTYFATDIPSIYIYNGTSWLQQRYGLITATFISTDNTCTNSSSFVDLAVADSLTYILSGTENIVINYTANAYHNATNAVLYGGVFINGTQVDDGNQAIVTPNVVTSPISHVVTWLATGQTGTNTVDIKHKVTAGIGHWRDRLLTISVTP